MPGTKGTSKKKSIRSAVDDPNTRAALRLIEERLDAIESRLSPSIISAVYLNTTLSFAASAGTTNNPILPAPPITTTGGIVIGMLRDYGGRPPGSHGRISMARTGNNVNFRLEFRRNLTVVREIEVNSSAIGATRIVTQPPVSSFWFVDKPPAGAYGYDINLNRTLNGTELEIDYLEFILFELMPLR